MFANDHTIWGVVCALLVFGPFDSIAQEIGSEGASTATITRTIDIRELTDIEAATNIPVRIEGVVSLYKSKSLVCFVHDETGGIYVYNTEVLLHSGQRVVVTGTTDAGNFLPIVLPETIEAIGTAPLPDPIPMKLDEVNRGGGHSQWLEVEGVVVSKRRTNDRYWNLKLTNGAGELDVLIMDRPSNLPNLEGQEVVVQGIGGSIHNALGHVLKFHLITPDLNFVQRIGTTDTNPFDLPLIKIDQVRVPRSFNGSRVHIRGVVSLVLRPWVFFIQDGSSGIRVQTSVGESLQRGDIVEAVGYPGLGKYSPRIEHAIARKLGRTKRLLSYHVSVDQALQGASDGRFVRVSGILIESRSRTDNGPRLILSNSGRVFSGHFKGAENPGAIVEEWEIGSRLDLKGVCHVNIDEHNKAKSFEIWMQSTDDVTVVSNPPLLTGRGILWIASGVGLIGVLGTTWMVVLRRQVNHHTRAIQDREAKIEAMYRELFENAYDIIYQHQLDGSHVSMNGAGQKLLGYSEQELNRMNILELVAESDRDRMRKELTNPYPGKGAPMEFALHDHSGKKIQLEGKLRVAFHDGDPFEIRGIARDITARKSTEMALRESEKQLRGSLEEREQFCRDLHDDVIQSIYGIGLGLERTRTLLWDESEVAGQLKQGVAGLNSVIRKLRSFIVDGCINQSKPNEIESDLDRFARTASNHGDCQVELSIDPEAARALGCQHGTQVTNIAREAISNSLRHSRSDQIKVCLKREQRDVILNVEDDGIGFSMPNLSKSGNGLANMSNRVQALGGTIKIESKPQRGTRVKVNIPIAADETSK